MLFKKGTQSANIVIMLFLTHVHVIITYKSKIIYLINNRLSLLHKNYIDNNYLQILLQVLLKLMINAIHFLSTSYNQMSKFN